METIVGNKVYDDSLWCELNQLILREKELIDRMKKEKDIKKEWKKLLEKSMKSKRRR
jgi:hypothetical protein